MTSGLYSSLMCALGHPSAISGVARAASEGTFHPFLAKKPHAVQEKKKKKKDTMFNLPPSSGKKVNLKVG